MFFFPSDELPVSKSGDDYDDGENKEDGNKNPFPEATVDEHRAQRE